MKVEVDVPNKPTVCVNVKQHFNQFLSINTAPKCTTACTGMGKWLQTLLFHPMLDEQTAGFQQKKDEETIPNKYIYSLQTRQT